jgi:hypothetical protein
MIYCGYQGSGKSTYCRNNPDTTIDLDSSAFVKVAGWEENYVRTAVALATNKNVFISAHRVVIEYCMKNSIPFVVLAPSQSKEAWRSRLEFRYHKNPILANFKAIADFEQNFDSDLQYYRQLESRGICVRWIEATVVTNIGENIF